MQKESQKVLYYHAVVEEGVFIRTPSIKTVYLHQNEATFALKFEPWILDTANSLSQVHGYQKVFFGDGATLKTENNVKSKKNGTLVPMFSRPPGENFWFDKNNFSKWCVEGAI